MELMRANQHIEYISVMNGVHVKKFGLAILPS